MPVSTYAELQTSVGSWLNRADMTGQIPDFIRLFEARVNRILRVPEMEVVSTFTATQESTALPSDFLSLREVRVAGKLLPSMNPQQLREAARISGGTTIKGYSVVGTALLLAPAPSEVGSVIKITYYQRLPALSVSNTVNWLLTAHPDLYLFGTLTVASAYLKDDERTGIWKNAWDEALGEVMAAGIKARQPATPLVMRSGVSE